MRAPRSLLILLFGSSFFCAHAEPSMQTFDVAQLKLSESQDMAAAIAWKVPAQVTFALDGGPKIDGALVRLAGFLTNDSGEPQHIVVFAAGPLGFFLQPLPGHARKLPSGPPMPPPMPPPPTTFTLPAHSRVRIETVLALSEWEWIQGQTHELSWSFNFWNEPKPRGTVLLP